MCFEKDLYSSAEGIDDILDDDVNDMQKNDVEEQFWGDDPDRYVDYDTTDDYTFVDTTQVLIDDLIDDEIHEVQAQDVEEAYWGNLEDDADVTDYDGRQENTIGW